MTRRGLLIALMTATGAAVTSGQDKFALANDDVKQLLLLMDTDKSGKVSKREWMNFMEAEFDRLDKDGNGELDPNELRQASWQMKRPK